MSIKSYWTNKILVHSFLSLSSYILNHLCRLLWNKRFDYLVIFGGRSEITVVVMNPQPSCELSRAHGPGLNPPKPWDRRTSLKVAESWRHRPKRLSCLPHPSCVTYKPTVGEHKASVSRNSYQNSKDVLGQLAVWWWSHQSSGRSSVTFHPAAVGSGGSFWDSVWCVLPPPPSLQLPAARHLL